MAKQVQQIRWKPLELFGVFTYINDNFDKWQENHRSVCKEAIRETNINRDEKATYSKVYNMIKAMEEYHDTGRRSPSYAVMWDNKNIYDLVEKVYNKTKEKKESEKRTNEVDDDIEMDMNEEQTSLSNVVKDNLSIAAVNKLYEEKIGLISQNQFLLIKKIEEANDTFERSNVKIFYSTDKAKGICNDKVIKITKLRNELIDIINFANNKYEELKSFQ